MRIAGVISDTHGLLRPEAMDALAGVDLIIHAGDVGTPEVLARLETIAPVHAVSGNVDRPGWLPATCAITVHSARVYVVHRIADLDVDDAEYQAIIFGHSHNPSIENRAGVLYLNPGSAGPRRFRLPVTLARLHVREAVVSAEIIRLER
jgi:putative phosphoesterase